MNESPDKHERSEVASKTGTVRLSVAGQVIQVPWEDLLDPSKWFAAEPPSDSVQD